MNQTTHCPKCEQPLAQVGQFWICPEHGQISLEKPFAPLRIFLSYGHDSNEELVRRIRADLETRGHDVWFDQSEVKTGHDWRRAITDGIVESHRVLSFLSKYSTRDPGVCLDEIAIAIGVKGGNIQTILVESEQEVRPPPSISHIQWLDMHDWKEQRAAAEAVWEKWYQEKLAEIVGVVESDESRRFAGEIKTLEGHLKAISSDSRIGQLLKKPLVGRVWLVEAIEQWRNADRASRLFWITGAPGVGKSAFAAHLAHYGRDKVIAVQFCEYDKPDHRNADRIVRTLAFQIATRLPDYRKLLLTLPELTDLDRKNPAELFDCLLADPLRHAIDGGRERYLIVIDALDEAGENGRNELVEMLARNAPRLPEWIGIVVTSRPESDVIAPLQNLNPFVLDTATESNRTDVRDYLLRELASHLHSHPDADRLVEQILEKSEGVFLYVERFCDDVQCGHLSLDRPEQFPRGLGGIFFQYFQRQFPDLEKFRQDVRPALRAILAAREPLPVEILQRLFNWQDEELRDFTRSLGSLFPVTTESGHDAIKPYHKSLLDWLAEEAKARAYYVSVLEGHRMFAQSGWDDFQSDPEKMFSYFLKHLLAHLLLNGDRLRAAQYYSAELDSTALYHATWSLAEHLVSHERAVSARNSDVIALLRTPDLEPQDLLAMAKRYIILLDTAVRDRCTIETRSTLLTTIDEVVSTLGQSGISAPLWLSVAADCKDRIGDLSALQLNYEQALSSYRDALELRQLLARVGQTPDWLQRNISVSHNKIGDMQVQLGRDEEALTEFRKAYNSRAKNASRPHASVSDRRDLSVSHNRLSLALDGLGRTSEALEEIEKSIAIRETLAREAFGNDAVQRDLDTVRHQGAMILSRLNRAAEAKVILEGILERCLDRSRREPRNLKFLRDTAATHNALGAVELRGVSFEAASSHFSEGAAYLRQALSYDPGNPTLINLFTSLLLSSADLDLACGNQENAANSSREACDVLRPLLEKEQRPEDERSILAAAESVLAEIHFRRGEMQAARNGFERSADILEKLPNLRMLESSILEKAFHTYGRLGSLLLQDASQMHEAERLIKRSVEIGSHLILTQTSQSWVHGDLAANLQDLGTLLAQRGEREEAIRAYLSAATLVDQQLEVRAEDPGRLQQLMEFHWKVLNILSPDEILPDGHSSHDSDSQRNEIQLVLRVVAAAERRDCDLGMLASTLTLLAGVELAVGERNEALDHLKRSLALRLRTEEKAYGPAVVMDVRRIVALEETRGDLDLARSAVRDGIALLQRAGGKHNPLLTGLWSTLGYIYRQCGNREEARAAFAESYEILLEIWGPEDEKTRKSLYQILALDTRLEEFDRAGALCLHYFDGHPEIKRILQPLDLIAQDAARAWAVRNLVLGPERLSGKEAMGYEMQFAAEQALLANGADEASLQSRLGVFLKQDGEAFLRAGLAIINLVLNGSAS